MLSDPSQIRKTESEIDEDGKMERSRSPICFVFGERPDREVEDSIQTDAPHRSSWTSGITDAL